MELLKGLGIGKEVGTEQTAQKLWMKFLGRFDYKPDQALPDNMTKGTNRILSCQPLTPLPSLKKMFFKLSFSIFFLALFSNLLCISIV